jgi:hypothetical protein
MRNIQELQDKARQLPNLPWPNVTIEKLNFNAGISKNPYRIIVYYWYKGERYISNFNLVHGVEND